MSRKSKPHSGSKSYYPRVRAKKQTPSFRSFGPKEAWAGKGDVAKPLNFMGYKVGMLQLMGTDRHERAVSYGQEIIVPATAIECPPMKVFGIRAYGKVEGTYGMHALGDVLADNVDKDLRRRIRNFKKKGRGHGRGAELAKEGKGGRETVVNAGAGGKGTEKAMPALADMEKAKDKILEIRLLVHTQPRLSGGEKKRPDVSEIALTGGVNSQLEYAKSKLGQELRVGDVFEEKQFVDVRAVNKGHGFEGPVKRFGVKTQRPKSKTQRIVGSIGPWNPSTVMYTVARAGQMGYHNRTEINKRIIMMGADASAINPVGGFRHYGKIENEFLLLAGSVPGPAKRAVAMRRNVRKAQVQNWKVVDLKVSGRKNETRAEGEAEGEEAA
ncbi:MAG: 50S ribosomal protein L3 [Candidatus Diapherotrites archaeon]